MENGDSKESNEKLSTFGFKRLIRSRGKALSREKGGSISRKAFAFFHVWFLNVLLKFGF